MNKPCARITLDLQHASTPTFVAVKKSDIGREIRITLSDGGFPYEISADCYAVLTGTKPDGNILYNHCDIEGNTIVYEITEQTTAAAGRMKAEVKLYGADDILVTSATFRIIIDGTVYTDDKVESSSEFSALTQLISQVVEIIQKYGDVTTVTKTSELINDSGFITNAVSDLVNYYTKTDIGNLISNIPKFRIAVVSVLPTENISETTIYLLPGGDGSDLYTEYLRVDGKWEIIGSQRVDLTGYATEQWVREEYQPKGNYLTEHQDISGKLDANKLPEAINDALAQAKESGEFDGQDGNDYVLTEADRIEIAEMAAGLVDVPGSGGNVDLTGYATEQFVRDGYQQKGNYLESSALPTAVNDALAQAKASGEFDGKDGNTPVKGVDYFDGNPGKTAYAYAQEAGYTGTEEEFAEKLAQEPLVGTTEEITPSQVAEAIAAGRDVAIAHTSSYGHILFANFCRIDAFDVIASSAILDYDGSQIVLALFGQLSTNQWFMPNPVTLATKSDIPSALPNPELLTFKPGTNTLFSELLPISYRGESAQTVYIPTKTSHLENDSGFLTSAPVTSVNGKTGAVSIDIPTVPSALKNPYALTINGKSYDGSAAVNMTIEGGSGDSIPDYVRTEAERVAAVVQSHQNANTFSFLACSDPHCSLVQPAAQITESIMHMGQAMGLLRKWVNIDFAVYLGDTIYSSAEGVDGALQLMRFFSGCIADGFHGIPNFRVRGNYENLSSADVKVSDTQIYTNIGIHNRGAVYDDSNRESGYCYRDFEDWKIRVVLINVNEDDTGSFVVSDAQCTWLASALNLSAKGDGWRSILLSHQPLDWGNQSSNVMQVIKQASNILCAFHGHLHNFKVDTITGTDITRIAIPNAHPGRDNTYGRNDGAENQDGIEYGEDITYTKTAGTAEDTSFCVVTVDLAAKKIYADHYGAGYSRVIPLDDAEVTIYAVTNTLTNVTNNNGSATVSEGASYAATLAAEEGYTISSVSVTMGGIDVTASVYSSGKINIPSVSGDVVITAVAEETPTDSGNYTNLVPTAMAADGSVYNGTGYKDGAYVSAGGNYGSDTSSGCTATGFIPYKSGDVIYIKGGTLSAGGRARLYFQEGISNASAVALFGSSGYTDTAWTVTHSDGDRIFQIEKLGDQYYKLTPNDALKTAIDADDVYRLSLYGRGEDLIITHNEPIE